MPFKHKDHELLETIKGYCTLDMLIGALQAIKLEHPEMADRTVALKPDNMDILFPVRAICALQDPDGKYLYPLIEFAVEEGELQ